jgi:peroxiredoxin Q/BCP
MSPKKSRSLLGSLLLLFSAGNAQADALKPGNPAPGFSLLDQNSKQHSLDDYQGQWLVVYFYPKDDTPGCTTEACEFRDDYYVLKEMGVTVLGVSLDDVESHQEFAEKYHLPFPLLSDADAKVATAYGSLTKFGPIKFAKRHTYIIDSEGRIAHIYRDVKPKEHSDQVIKDLRAMME